MDRLVADEQEVVEIPMPPREIIDEHTRAEIEQMLSRPGGNADLRDLLEEIWAGIPDEAWNGLPADLSINLDHYLYGAPKVKP